MAYRPILELLRRYLGLSDGITREELLGRVAEQLQFLGLEGEERSVLLAHFLGVSAPQEFLNRLSGPQLKERTFGALREVFLRASETAPLVLIVENLHWIDTASEEFLAHLAGGLPGQRVLLVLTTRPGYAAPWLAPPLAETITLEGLGAGDVRGMVRTLLTAEDVSEQLFKILAERSEGNPLYVEEILRQLQETGGILVEDGEARLGSPDVTVPATIHDIIAARVDRLAEPLKHTLQGAAVVGRRFGMSLLSRILEVASDRVAGHLRELHSLDFVFPSAQEPELMYSFKHALTQDVVYAGVLERRRRQHHAAADPPRRAAWCYWTGFLHSITGARPDTAIAYCREALAIADASGLEEIRAFAECCLTHVYSVSGDLREGLAAGKRALAMFEARGNVWWICRTLWGLMSVANGLGEWNESLEYCRRALEYGQAVNDLRLKVVGWWRTGSTHVQRGDPESGLRCCEEALALSPIPFDTAMVKAVKGYGLTKPAKFDAGIAELAEALEWLERSHLGHFRWLYGYWLVEGYLRQGDRARARALVEEILATGREESRRAEGVGERLLGESLMSEAPTTAAPHLETAARVLEEIGA